MKNKLPITNYQLRVTQQAAFILVICLLWLILAQTAQAATYYCDAAQAGMNHAGTEADPYSEVDMNNVALDWGPGDTIYCKGAFGNIVCADQTYGSAGGGYVTWAAWPGFTPDANFIDMPDNTENVYLALDGWNLDRGWTDDDPDNTIDLDDTSYIWIKNCTLQGGKNATLTGDFAPYFIVLDGNANACISDHSGTSNYITVENCAFSNTFTGVYVTGTHWTIKNSTFKHIASDGVVLTNTTSDCIIQDCRFNDVNDYYGMFGWAGTATGDWSGHQYEEVTNDTSNHSGKFVLISGAGRFCIVADDANAKAVRAESAGSKWVLDSDNAVYFTVSGGGDSAHTDCVEVVGGDEGAEDIVERCWFGPNIKAQAAKLEDNGDDPYIEFRNNVAVAAIDGGVLLLTSGAGGEINIYNNIIICTNRYVRAARIHYPTRHLYNNIFSGLQNDYHIDVDADYNIWLDSYSNIPPEVRGGHDLYGVNPALLFVNYAAGDYNLPSGSPAIDIGDDSFTNTTDFTGTANVRVTYAPPDIGAYEYAEASGDILGDITGDGEVSINDVQACVSIILFVETDLGMIQRADISGQIVGEPDGLVNIYDLQELVNMVLAS